MLDKCDETELYSAIVEPDNIPVWLKTLSVYSTGDLSAHKNLQFEAEVLSRLSSKNIIRILNFEPTTGQNSLIVEEALDGRSLRRLILEHGAFTFEEALPIVIQLCDALTVMHRNFVVSGCLRPERIFLHESDDLAAIAKVIDLSKSCEFYTDFDKNAARSYQAITLADQEICYYSPEQIRGKKIDARADIFSLAVLMYEMLHGKPAFSGAEIKATLRERQYLHPSAFLELSPDSVFPEDLEKVVLKAMDEDADERYQSANEFKNALLFTIGGDGVRKVERLYAELQSMLRKYRLLRGT